MPETVHEVKQPEQPDACAEPLPDEMGFCLHCDVDIYLPRQRDWLCPGCEVSDREAVSR
jgi:hypothetical protein